MSNYEMEKKLVKSFAKELEAEGLTVYLSKSGKHGVFTDKSKQRVVSFETRYFCISLSGKYQKSKENGCGWCMENEDIKGLSYKEILYLNPPTWIKNPRPCMTFKQYMDIYGSQYPTYN